MWLVNLFKKLLKLFLFLLVVGVLTVVFVGSFWFNNDYNLNMWSGYFSAPAQHLPTGLLTGLFPDVGSWYSQTVGNSALLQWLVPVGFGVAFGIIVYTLLSIFFALIRRMVKRKK